MRFLRAFLRFILFVGPLSCFAQDHLHAAVSTPLPALDPAQDLRFAWDSQRLGCAEDGSLFLSEAHGDGRLAPVIAKVATNGTLQWSVDSERVADLGKTDLDDFAPGPGGELFLLVKRVAKEYSSIDEEGHFVQGGHADHPGDWLVRYDSDGQYLDKKTIPMAHRVRMAVFPSGEMFLLSYTIQGWPFRQGDPPHHTAVLAGVFSKDGVLIHKVSPPDFFLDKRSGWPRSPSPDPLPMLGRDGNVYVVKEGDSPAVAVISQNGSVLRSLALAIPEGKRLDNSRLFGKHLLARETNSDAKSDAATKPLLVEVDTETGQVVSNYLTGKTVWWPGCDQGSGLVAIDPETNTLDLLEPVSQ